MYKTSIYSYKFGSQSAKLIADRLGIKRIKHSGSRFKGRSSKTVINWGSSELPVELHKCKIINEPIYVKTCSNKTYFFADQSINHDSSARLVPWTVNKLEAQNWLDEDFTVVVRNSLTSHSGHGILIVEPDETLPDAPLYTKYIKKDSEWRIHCMRFGEECRIISRQRKIKDPNLDEPVTWKIRSHQNGFIFQHSDLNVPEDVEVQALLAFKNSGLHFGAVDVIFNKHQNKAYTLELNTAPGVSGETLEVYKENFMEMLNV